MLSDNPQEINSLAGITLGAIVQIVSALVIGYIIGLSFNWQVGLVGIACTAVLVSAGYIRLVCYHNILCLNSMELTWIFAACCRAQGSTEQ